jgi:D-alanine transaminase
MPEIIWFNGRIMPMSEARVSVEDRGFQFADGVYEAMRLYHGRPFRAGGAPGALERSAAGIKLAGADGARRAGRADPVARRSEWRARGRVVPPAHPRRLSAQPRVAEAGTCRRRFSSTRDRCLPSSAPDQSNGYALWSVRDERWRKCWIKAICLTASALAPQRGG